MTLSIYLQQLIILILSSIVNIGFLLYDGLDRSCDTSSKEEPLGFLILDFIDVIFRSLWPSRKGLRSEPSLSRKDPTVRSARALLCDNQQWLFRAEMTHVSWCVILPGANGFVMYIQQCRQRLRLLRDGYDCCFNMWWPPWRSGSEGR